MNRPKKKAADRRSVLIVTRVTKAENKQLRQQAKAAGKMFATWLRDKLLG